MFVPRSTVGFVRFFGLQKSLPLAWVWMRKFRGVHVHHLNVDSGWLFCRETFEGFRAACDSEIEQLCQVLNLPKSDELAHDRFACLAGRSEFRARVLYFALDHAFRRFARVPAL